MKKRMLKVVLSAALALSAATAIPQSLTANAWARNGSEFVNTAGAYKVRQAIAPAVNFCSTAGVYVTIAGVVISYIIDKNLMNGIGYTISTIGIVMYSVAVIFYAVTLWIERDASKRGWKAMQQFGWVSQDQLSAAQYNTCRLHK